MIPHKPTVNPSLQSVLTLQSTINQINEHFGVKPIKPITKSNTTAAPAASTKRNGELK